MIKERKYNSINIHWKEKTERGILDNWLKITLKIKTFL